jgi:2-methylisocitrate lyase-like PEP mutase family enzyme
MRSADDPARVPETVRLGIQARHAGCSVEDYTGRDDIGDTIARLQAYQEAGADVLFAAGLTDREHIRQLISAVDLPVSVIARPGSASVG